MASPPGQLIALQATDMLRDNFKIRCGSVVSTARLFFYFQAINIIVTSANKISIIVR